MAAYTMFKSFLPKNGVIAADAVLVVAVNLAGHVPTGIGRGMEPPEPMVWTAKITVGTVSSSISLVDLWRQTAQPPTKELNEVVQTAIGRLAVA